MGKLLAFSAISANQAPAGMHKHISKEWTVDETRNRHSAQWIPQLKKSKSYSETWICRLSGIIKKFQCIIVFTIFRGKFALQKVKKGCRGASVQTQMSQIAAATWCQRSNFHRFKLGDIWILFLHTNIQKRVYFSNLPTLQIRLLYLRSGHLFSVFPHTSCPQLCWQYCVCVKESSRGDGES